MCIRKICKLNSFQFLFVSPRSSRASRNSFFPSSTCSPTAKTLLIRFPRKRFRKGSERTVSLFENSTPQKFSVLLRLSASNLEATSVSHFSNDCKYYPRARDGLNDARSFLRFEKRRTVDALLVYLPEIKRINRPRRRRIKIKRKSMFNSDPCTSREIHR